MVVEARRRWRSARGWSLAVAIGASVPGAGALDAALPNKTDSLKFAVIGDFGTGQRPSYELAAQMAAHRVRFPFDIVLTTGDNIIGDQDDPSDFVENSSARSGRCSTRASGSTHRSATTTSRRIAGTRSST